MIAAESVAMYLRTVSIKMWGWAVCLVGCAQGQADLFAQDAKPSGFDAVFDATPTSDASTSLPDGEVVPVGGPAHLLLSEVVTAPTIGEYLEIVNPTNTAVDLSNYYVSDSGNYFRLPAEVPTMGASDFLARFPAGSTIAAGAVVTIALATAANFELAHGVPPSFSLRDNLIIVAESGTATFTNDGELATLFYWDGQSDLVVDVDLVLAGRPSIGNQLVDKSLVSLDGPDVGTTTTTYAVDGKTLPLQTTVLSDGTAARRMLREAGHETQAGNGNGVGGDDETTEDTTATWNIGPPSPGVTELSP